MTSTAILGLYSIFISTYDLPVDATADIVVVRI